MSETGVTIVLASASPRRQEYLRKLGLPHTVLPVHIDERVETGEAALDYVRRMAAEKADMGARQSQDYLCIGADTIVLIGDTLLLKPESNEEATEMLEMLSGRKHSVITAVALADRRRIVVRHAITRVHFKELNADHIAWYIQTGEPFDKAGAYGIQGYAGLFIDRIEGSWSNVVGLPLHVLPELFESFNLDFFSLLDISSGSAEIMHGEL